MQLFSAQRRLPERVRALSRSISRTFPVPRSFMLPDGGVDISDASVKWVVLEKGSGGTRVRTWGEIPLHEGVVEGGVVYDVRALADALAEMKKNSGRIIGAHAALPAEAARIFSMHVPNASKRDEVLSHIEFELETRAMIPVSNVAYDFDVIGKHETGEIGVAVFPKQLIDRYVAAFEMAGIHLASLEVDVHSIARALSDPSGSDPVTLLIELDDARVEFSILKSGVAIFTTSYSAPREDVSATGVMSDISVAEEAARIFRSWDTRRNEYGARITPIERVYLFGGHPTLQDLVDRIEERVKTAVHLPNVWRNVTDLGSYLPPIDRQTSLQYATAIGLALRGL